MEIFFKDNIDKIFIRFLKENNCYRQFYNNINSDACFDKEHRYKYIFLKNLISCLGYKNLISCSFRWSKTQEGEDFWVEIGRKWNYILKIIQK